MKDIIAKRLRECRHKAGYTQMQIAAYSGITKTAYANYETARRLPKPSVLIKIADVYRISLDYLVGRTDDPNLKLTKPWIKP